MKKEYSQKIVERRSDIQGDTVKKPANQAKVPFLYRPVEYPFEQTAKPAFSNKKLYRVIKIK